MARKKDMTVRDEDTAKTPTIYVALDLGRRRWTVGVLLPGDRAARIFQIASGDREGLSRLIGRQREIIVGPDVRVVSCYEAGRDGFWLHRWLRDQGIDNRVLDPASLEVPRRRRRVKTDRVDTLGLLRVLLRLDRDETEIARAIWVPSPPIEDARQRTRARERLVKERTAHLNRIQGLLVAQGVTSVKVGARDWLDQLTAERTGDGRPLGAALLADIRREVERLALVERQIEEVEAAQRAVLKTHTPLAVRARKLKRLKGLGEVFANGLTHEAFWRDFENRRQVGGAFGLTPWPWESGDTHTDQPISKAGNRRARTLAIECAWMWTFHQPGSALTRWWQQRFARGSKRQRRIGIVALARKLMVALWRYLKEDLIPEGAVLG